MKQTAEKLWTHQATMQLGAVPLPLRMTVIKLSDEKLWLHSPTPISDNIKQQVDALGTLAYIIAPNNAHNLWLEEWQQAYPNAEVFVTRGVPKKLPDLKQYNIIEDQTSLPWQADIAHASMPGVSFFDEQAFFHPASRSLILTDLVQHHRNEPVEGFKANVSQWLLKKIGFNGICTAPPLKMKFLIKDKPGFKQFLQSILNWDFQRIVITHGEIISDQPKKTLEVLFQRFLKD